MSLASMTGFADGTGAKGPLRWRWEAKSVNGRSLDLRLRTPPGHDGLEAQARRLAAERFLRGAFQISLTVETDAASRGLAIDAVALASAVKIAREVAAETGLAPARVDGLLALKGVIVADEGVSLDEPARAARDAAREHGIAAVAIHGSTHFGAAGFYARWLAGEGLVAVVTSNSEPVVVPFGGRSPLFGTNPFAFAAPTSGAPISLDMATSTSAMGKVMVAQAEGRSVPAEVLAAHPRTAYLNEAHVLPKLDAWIASLADPVEVAHMQEPDPSEAAKAADLRAQIKDVTKKIDALVAAIEAGADLASVTEKLRMREAERALAQTRLDDLSRAPGALSPADIEALTERLGGIATILADAPADKRRALRVTGPTPGVRLRGQQSHGDHGFRRVAKGCPPWGGLAHQRHASSSSLFEADRSACVRAVTGRGR